MSRPGWRFNDDVMQKSDQMMCLSEMVTVRRPKLTMGDLVMVVLSWEVTCIFSRLPGVPYLDQRGDGTVGAPRPSDRTPRSKRISPEEAALPKSSRYRSPQPLQT
jgi:hypothetical protein